MHAMSKLHVQVDIHGVILTREAFDTTPLTRAMWIHSPIHVMVYRNTPPLKYHIFILK